jgi:hypothetical protein
LNQPTPIVPSSISRFPAIVVPALLAVLAGPLAHGEEAREPTKFDALVTRIVLDNIPHEIVEDDDWGKTDRVWDGVRIWWEGTRLESKRRWKTVNQGTWQWYRVRLIDPEQRFQVQVENVRPLPDGRVGFEAEVEAALDVFGRISQWQRDVQLFSLSANATAVVRLRVSCSLAMKLDPTRFPPDVLLDPQITSADLQLVRFQLRRISQLHGPLVRELGAGAREFIEDEIAGRRGQIVNRANRQLDKHRDDLRLSLHDLLASRWGDLAASQLQPPAETSPP